MKIKGITVTPALRYPSPRKRRQSANQKQQKTKNKKSLTETPKFTIFNHYPKKFLQNQKPTRPIDCREKKITRPIDPRFSNPKKPAAIIRSTTVYLVDL